MEVSHKSFVVERQGLLALVRDPFLKKVSGQRRAEMIRECAEKS
jgi:hypothetical protein